MMKEKGQFKKKFVKKIATIMMAAAMVVSGGFGVAPAAIIQYPYMQQIMHIVVIM